MKITLFFGGFLLILMLAFVATTRPAQSKPIFQTEERVSIYDVEILQVIPHDTNAYTQGWLWHDGLIYESTGRKGQSTVRVIDPATGEVLRMVSVPPEYFAEGLALVDDRLIQLTWQENTAFIYDRATFEQIGTYTYEGEGWGLCYNEGDGFLYMTDGTPRLFRHDPTTFERLETLPVTLYGLPVDELNEIACVGDYVYANIWQTDFIVQIEKTSGRVVGVIVVNGLLTDEERANLGAGGTLNGITFSEDTQTFWITGKLYPKMFEVRFIPREES